MCLTSIQVVRFCRQGMEKITIYQYRATKRKFARDGPSQTLTINLSAELEVDLDADLGDGLDGVGDDVRLNLLDNEHELSNDGEVDGCRDVAHIGGMQNNATNQASHQRVTR